MCQCTEKTPVHHPAKNPAAKKPAVKKVVAAAKKVVAVNKHAVKKSGGHTYHLVKVNKSWREAQAYCAKKGYGHLVIIRDAKSQKALDSYIKGVGGQ